MSGSPDPSTASPIAVRAIAGALRAGVIALLVGTAAQGEEINAALNETLLTVPKEGILFTTKLETTIFKPAGAGPFPIVVINHGKSLGYSRHQGRYRPLMAARYFMQRGYVVVVPMRQGFSKSGGLYVGSGCNVEGNGLAQADDVRAVVQHYAKRPDIDATRVVVFGQSHGGLTTLALGSLNLPGVIGLVNFAGGLRQEQCVAWETGLATAFGNYGRATKVPSLWFYGDNDSYWAVPVWREMLRQYTEAGGQARIVAYGPFGSDAHGMFGARAGVAIWLPEVEKFFRELGLPFDKAEP